MGHALLNHSYRFGRSSHGLRAVPRPRSARPFISPKFVSLKNRLEELIRPALATDEDEEEKAPVVKMTEGGDVE